MKKIILKTIKRLVQGLAFNFAPLLFFAMTTGISYDYAIVLILWCWLVGTVIERVVHVAFTTAIKQKFTSREDREEALETVILATIEAKPESQNEQLMTSILSLLMRAKHADRLIPLYQALVSPDVLERIDPDLNKAVEKKRKEHEEEKGTYPSSSNDATNSSDNNEIVI